MLAAGALVRNIAPLAAEFRIDTEWSRLITKALCAVAVWGSQSTFFSFQTAVVLILIRCGWALDAAVLRDSWRRFASLGFVSTIVEGAVIFAFAAAAFGVPPLVAVLFA